MLRPLSLAAGTLLDADAFTVVRSAADAGFASIGLRISHTHAVAPDRLDSLVAHCRQHGVTVHDVEVHRIGSGEDHAPLVEVAAALGASWLLVVSDLADDDEGRARTRQHLARIVADAARAGVRVGLEYMAWTAPRSSRDAVRMAHDTGARLVVDVLHHHRLREGPAELAAVVDSGTLGWVQVCDAPRQSPTDLLDEARHRRMMPGTGELPLGELLAVVPPDTTLSAEVQNDALAATTSADERAVLAFDATAAIAGR